MPKFQNIASILENRIRHGDYLLKEVPCERELAAEVQVSRMTARKAILHLVETGLLVRQSNKRLAVRRDLNDSNKIGMQVAFLAPAYSSPFMEQWHLWLKEMAGERNIFFRDIGYCHWDDAVITDTIEGFDGIFFLPLSEEIPANLLQRIKQAGHPVVVLGQDLSEHGIPSLQLTSPSMVQKLLDYLGSLGHKHINCLNTQHHEQVVLARIEQWELWLAVNGGKGQLFDEPVPLYHSPSQGAYETVTRLLKANKIEMNTALFCATTGAALGALRAMYEAGIKVGKDISVCSAEDGADIAPFLTPSLTCLRDRNPGPYLGVCVEWMLRGGKNWLGPLSVQPAEAILFEGETTGPFIPQHHE